MNPFIGLDLGVNKAAICVLMVRSLLIGRHQFMSAMLQIGNTIRGLLRTQGLKLGRVPSIQVQRAGSRIVRREPMMLPAIEPLLAARDEMRVEVRKLDNALERASRAGPVCKLFRTIPGVSPLTALSTVTRMRGCPRSFLSLGGRDQMCALCRPMIYS